MKPRYRRGKGLPGIGGNRCNCCKTGMSKHKRNRIIRHRGKNEDIKEFREE